MIKKDVTNKDLKEFGLLIGVGFPLIIGLIIPIIFGHEFKEWPLFIGLFSLFFAFIKPSLLFYPYKFWMFIGNCLGWINSRIILGLIFLLVVIPIAFIMKIIGHDPLNNKKSHLHTYKQIKKNHIIDLKRIF